MIRGSRGRKEKVVAEFVGALGKELLHEVNGLPGIGRRRRDPATLFIEFAAFRGGKPQAVFEGVRRHPKQAFFFGEHEVSAAFEHDGDRRRFLFQSEVGGENVGLFHDSENVFHGNGGGCRNGCRKTDDDGEKTAEEKTHVSDPFPYLDAKNRRS